MHGYSVICCSSGQENKLVYPFMKTHLRFFLEKRKSLKHFKINGTKVKSTINPMASTPCQHTWYNWLIDEQDSRCAREIQHLVS